MTGSDAEVLARLRLVQGRSDNELREFVRSRGQTQMLTVGSDAECDWCIRESGVAPIQFSLHWDGSNLRIADTHGAGNVRVEGTILTSEWRRLGGRMRIDFGRAAMVAESGTPSDPSVHVAGSVRVAGQDSRPPTGRSTQIIDARPYTPREQPQLEERYTSDSRPPVANRGRVIEERQTQPEVTIATPPTTGLVLYREAELPGDEPRRQIRQHDSSARIPRGVVVLSPLFETAPPVPMARPTAATPPARQNESLPSWGTFALAWLALVGGYAVWLYLLLNI